MDLTIGMVDAKTETAGIHDEEIALMLLGHSKAELIDPESPGSLQVGRRDRDERVTLEHVRLESARRAGNLRGNHFPLVTGTHIDVDVTAHTGSAVLHGP